MSHPLTAIVRALIFPDNVDPDYILIAAMSALGDEDELKAMDNCISHGYLGKPEGTAIYIN